MQAFSAVEARSFDAPDPDGRAAAADRAAAATWPTTGDEIWRYSRIEELDLGGYRPAPARTTVVGGAECLVPVTNLTHVPSVVDGDAPDLFAELNAAFMTPVVLRVKPGQHVVGPVVITHEISGDGLGVFPRLIIEAGEDSELVVIERFAAASTEGGGATFVGPVVQVHAAQAARVSYLGVNELDDASWLIGHQQAVGERDSTITLGTVALGGHYARVRTEARVAGAGATTRQIALYFAGGDQMHDFRTIQDHDAPHTNSDLLFKGAVQDRSRSVYTGVIKIRPHARGTAAFQTNRNLTLGEHSWAESVPNLEIETNDVKCSHASTVGPIDPEHRFYLESRGIPSAIADRLVVLGFFDEVLQQLPTGPELAAELRTRVSAKLDLDRTLTGVA